MLTEDQIELIVERKFDALDRRFISGPMSQAEYDQLAHEIHSWAETALAADRAWIQFLDVLTGQAPVDTLPAELQPDPDTRTDDQRQDDDNWRDGSIRSGMRRGDQ